MSQQVNMPGTKRSRPTIGPLASSSQSSKRPRRTTGCLSIKKPNRHDPTPDEAAKNSSSTLSALVRSDTFDGATWEKLKALGRSRYLEPFLLRRGISLSQFEKIEPEQHREFLLSNFQPARAPKPAPSSRPTNHTHYKSLRSRKSARSPFKIAEDKSTTDSNNKLTALSSTSLNAASESPPPILFPSQFPSAHPTPTPPPIIRFSKSTKSNSDRMRARITSLLPAIRAANQKLEQERADGKLVQRNIENLREEDEYIEMELGLGVLEERKKIEKATISTVDELGNEYESELENESDSEGDSEGEGLDDSDDDAERKRLQSVRDRLSGKKARVEKKPDIEL